MTFLFTILLPYGLMTFGCALLALSQSQHWRCVTDGSPLSRTTPEALRKPMRLFGFALIAACLPLCIHLNGADFGSLLWFSLLTLGAFTITLLLSEKPVALRWIARLLSLIGRPEPKPAKT